jgi:hypothetical protein
MAHQKNACTNRLFLCLASCRCRSRGEPARGRAECPLGRGGGVVAGIRAPRIHFRSDIVANVSRLVQPLVPRPFRRRRIGKAPMKSACTSGKDGTAFCVRFVTDRNDVRILLSAFEEVERALRLVFANVDPNVAHYCDRQRVERSGLQPGAFRDKVVRATRVYEGFSDLTSG